MKSLSLATAICLIAVGLAFAADKFNPTDDALNIITKMKVGKYDWPQWGGSPHRNNTPQGENIPHEWNLDTGENVLWASPLGSQTYGNPVVANGKVFVGTNNTHGYLKRYPAKVDLGCLIAFEEKTGKFLWQASSPKLPTGRVNDWPQQGICSTVFCDDTRLWYNTSRGEVVCLDVEGFHDGENDGPFKAEANENKDEADIIWRYDLMGVLGVFQHNMCSCSVTCVGEYCFVVTGNGVDDDHINIPAPNAPSFICLDKNTGKLVWSDKSPGLNILHGQWSSPLVFEAGGQAQVVMGGGDGWIYSFDPAGDGKGGPKLLWKFDGNPKESIYLLGGRATRNHIIGTPVFYDGNVYAGVGEDPEHGEGVGHFYCIDPTKRGDVSIELAVGPEGKEIPPRRLQSVDRKKGEKAIPNPNSAIVWHYDSVDRNKNGKLEFEETMHRTIGSAAIKDDLLFISDFAGLVHCLDAKKVENGKPVVYWTHDMFAAAWGSVLIVDGKVYTGDEDGDIIVFELSKKLNVLSENNMINSIYSTPIVANNTLFISNKSTVFALKQGAKLKGGVKQGSTSSAGDSE
ncbi:MAG: PQQ-binding-like beta-propeller repeat protein [Planctomycetales bacterium]|nr:PQQ-binding-like beta-propeller repeat protein [Planctomycetales bacterium]